jgi:DNA-nicking Smr family endonuclease
MKSSLSSGTYRPFKNLKILLDEKSFPLASDHETGPVPTEVNKKKPDASEEEGLFQEVMADVVPILRDTRPMDQGPDPRPKVSEHDPEAEALARLEDLVRGGEGFIISDTAEYMEGLGYGVNPEIAKRLHRGDFSIQVHLDLHGLGVAEAHEAFEGFLKEALLAGNRAVLIVHGRGRSSRAEPVLKTKVREWLTSGPWRKWVIAFTSARACDGGAGATYVLLRQRPATKRHRKRASKK